MREKDRDVAASSQAVTQATADIAKTQQALARLHTRKAHLLQQRSTQASSISDHLAAAYRMNGRDLLKQVLNQESPQQLDRMLRYHQYFSRARINAVQRFQKTVAELEATVTALASEEQALITRRRALRDQTAALLTGRGEQRSAISALRSETASKTKRRQRLIADRARLESLLAELARRSTELDGSGFASAKGSLPMPLAARIEKAYGSKRSDGELTWNGLLFNAPLGTQVQAVYRGRVLFAEWLRGYGLLLILDHGGGYMTLYGHADSLTKAVGDWVESGETVASAGRSGGAPQSGLYFEVRHNGKTADPILWLKRNQ